MTEQALERGVRGASDARVQWALVASAILLLACELATIPLASTRFAYPWGGAWLLLSMLPVVGYALSRRKVPLRAIAALGGGCVLLLAIRYVLLDESRLAFNVVSPRRPLLAGWFVASAATMAALCVAGALFQRATRSTVELPRGAPQFRISHLLFWVACVALYMAAWRALHPTHAEALPAYTLFNSLKAGTAVVALPLFALRGLQGTAFPRYCGEYVLLALAVRSALELASVALQRGIDQWGTPIASAHAVDSLQLATVFTTSAIVLTALARANLPWRLYLAWYALSQLLPPALLYPWTSMSQSALIAVSLLHTMLIPAILLAIVIRSDYRSTASYPWTHWLGIGLALWSIAVNLLVGGFVYIKYLVTG